jgi:trimeric autotransporter adhesin
VGGITLGTALKTSSPLYGQYALTVYGGILSTNVKCIATNAADWADYVFDKNYELMPLKKVEEYVKENHHLPEIPSTEQILKEGLDLPEMLKLQMQKIEELTLHMIEMEKKDEAMQKEIEALKKENSELKTTSK